MNRVNETARTLAALLSDESRVLYGGAIDDIYSHDELAEICVLPDIVCKPHTTAEVSALLSYAYAHDIPVTPRGAGTGLVGAAVPVHGGIVLDLLEMKKILELDEDNLTVTVEPGVLLMELAEYVTANGFLYPPDPGEKTATIGGNISTNAGGMRAVKYGVTRDYVRALEVVLPDGRIIEVGGKVAKNSSGYDLKDLFIGAEGTIGVITRATLKLLPLPKHTVSLLVPFSTLSEAIDAVPAIIRSKASPIAVEFMQRDVIRAAEEYLGSHFPDNSADAYLLLKFDGNSEQELEKSYADTAELCLSRGACDVFIIDTEERSDTVWKARGAFLEAIKASAVGLEEVDVVVPRAAINSMVAYLEEVQKVLSVRIRYFGHAGDGNLHIYVLREENHTEVEWKALCEKAMRLMYDKARELGGQVSGEHGIGYIKQPYLFSSLSECQLSLMRQIKAVFDPKNIFNPDKIFEKKSLQ